MYLWPSLIVQLRIFQSEIGQKKELSNLSSAGVFLHDGNLVLWVAFTLLLEKSQSYLGSHPNLFLPCHLQLNLFIQTLPQN